MASKKLKLIGLIMAGTGVPYYFNEPQALDSLKNKATSFWQSEPPALTSNSFDSPAPATSESWTDMLPFWSDAPSQELELTPLYSLEELLRFDIDPRWVIDRWPRVTTVLCEQNLEGLRTPFITGTRVGDIAGSITYYFDRQHQLQRILVDGFTGDERPLVAIATSRFHLEAEPMLGGGLYSSKWNGRPVSVLRISRAPIVRASSPNSRLQFVLEINRPGKVALSPELQSILEADQQARRL